MKTDLLTKEESLTLYRKLVLARFSEEKIRAEYFKDEMKTPVHLGIGGEAIPIGVCHSLPKNTKVFGTYRNHALHLAMTEDTDSFFGEMYGRVTGAAKGKAGSMHLSSPENNFLATSAVVGTTIPLAVGAAMANRYRSSDDVVAVFFGDGAVEEGVFWESLNFASLKKLCVLFVCEDNGLAIHTASGARQGFASIQKAAEVFGGHVAGGDGSRLSEVIEKTTGVLNRMKTDPKPGFLHLSYYRFLEHVGPQEDFNAGYREKPSKEFLENKDPILLFEKELLLKGSTLSELETIRTEIRLKIDRSVAVAQKAPFAGAEELMTDIFA